MRYPIEAALGWHAKCKGITKTKIALNTGISTDAVSRAFKGKRKLTGNEALLICDFMDVHDPRELCQKYLASMSIAS